MWVVAAGHKVSLLPQILEQITHLSCYSVRQLRTQNNCPLKMKNICIYLVSSLCLSFKMPNFFSSVLPSSFLLGNRIPKLCLEPKFRFFGSEEGLK